MTQRKEKTLGKTESRLAYEVSGKAGGQPKFKDNVGRVTLTVDSPDNVQHTSDTISVDAFAGFGSTYSRRDRCEITVHSGSKGDVFTGTFGELVSRLRGGVPTEMVPEQPLAPPDGKCVAEMWQDGFASSGTQVGKSGEPDPTQEDAQEQDEIPGFDVLE